MEPPPGAPGEPAPWGQEPFAGQEPEELDGAAAGVMDRILLESVCQQQGWARVYGEELPGSPGNPSPRCA